MHEPASLPFGGRYTGFEEFRAFCPTVREFYDFSRFELLGVYGDGDNVFATIKAVMASNGGVIFLVEHFRFEGARIVEVRLHLCDDRQAALGSGLALGLECTEAKRFASGVVMTTFACNT